MNYNKSTKADIIQDHKRQAKQIAELEKAHNNALQDLEKYNTATDKLAELQSTLNERDAEIKELNADLKDAIEANRSAQASAKVFEQSAQFRANTILETQIVANNILANNNKLRWLFMIALAFIAQCLLFTGLAAENVISPNQAIIFGSGLFAVIVLAASLTHFAPVNKGLIQMEHSFYTEADKLRLRLFKKN